MENKGRIQLALIQPTPRSQLRIIWLAQNCAVGHGVLQPRVCTTGAYLTLPPAPSTLRVGRRTRAALTQP